MIKWEECLSNAVAKDALSKPIFELERYLKET